MAQGTTEGLHFAVTGDNSSLLSALRGTQNDVRKTAQAVEESGQSIDSMFDKMKKAAAGFAGALSVKEFGSKVMEIRGQFQQLEMAFNTMLQSESKATALMRQLVKTAATTPFDLTGVANGAKQLLAYGTEAEDVNATLIRLGDIAAGLSIPLNDLVYLYGTTMAQGRLYTQDLNQFTGRGIPMIQELAKQFGVADSKVKELVESGRVGFPEVQKVIESLTNEGGKFGGLMEAQSHTITGQIANIEDAVDMMFNEIGQSSEGVISSGLVIMGDLVENWQKVGEVVMVAATAYGSYKAVLMAVSALEALNNKILRQAVVERSLAAAAGVSLGNAEAVAAARTSLLTAAQRSLTVALKETAAATILNPYVMVAAAITGLVYTIYSHVTAITAEEAAQNAFNKTLDETSKSIDGQTKKIQDLIRTIQGTDTSSLQKQLAFDELGKIAPAIKDAYNSVDNLAKADLSQLNKQINELADENREKKIRGQIEEIRNILVHSPNAQKDLTDKFGIELSWDAGWSDYEEAADDLVNNLKTQLFEIEQAKGKVAAPTEIDVKLAKESYEQSKEELGYLSDFATAMKHDIEGNPTNVPFEGGEAEKVISSLENKIEALKKEQAESPITFTADKENALNTYVSLLSDIRSWKSEAQKKGVFDIPVAIRLKIAQLGKETEDKKKNFNYLTGEYEKSQSKTLADVYTAAQNAYTAATKKVANMRKNRKSYTQEQWEKAVSEQKTAKTAFENLGGDPDGKKSDAAAKKRKEAAEKRKKVQEDVDKDLLSLQRKNNEDATALMKEGTEKKIKEIDDDYTKRIAEIDKQEKEFKKKNKEAGYGEELTDAQSDALRKARDLAQDEKNKKTEAAYKEEISSMRDYLKEYGSFLQQKLAITEEYDEKIAKASNEGERLKLQKEKEKFLSALNYQELTDGIDWNNLLKGVGKLSSATLESMLGKLKAYTQTDEYKGSTLEDKQKVSDLITEIEKYVGSENVTWQQLGDSITTFQNSVNAYNEGVEKEKRAQEELAKAAADLKSGKIAKADYNNIAEKARTLGENVVSLKDEMQSAATDVDKKATIVSNSVTALTQALSNAGTWKGVEGFDGLQQMSTNLSQVKGSLDTALATMQNGTAKDVGSAISSGLSSVSSSLGSAMSSVMSSALGQIVGIIAQIPKLVLQIANAIKSFVTDILNSISELLKFEWLSDLIDSILEAIGNLIDTIFDLPENLYHLIESVLVKGIGGLLNTILGRVGNILSLGALSSKGPSQWFKNSNADDVQDSIDDLTEANETLNTSLNNLTDALDRAYGSETQTLYEQAVKTQQQINGNTLNKAKEQAGYHNNHNSFAYYWGNQWLDQVDNGDGTRSWTLNNHSGLYSYLADWVRENVSSSFDNTLESLWSFTPEQMQTFLGNADIYDFIKNLGKGGYGERVLEYLQEYADLAGKIDDLTDSFKESLTQISFDSMKDDFISNLMDMDKSAADFADDFSEYMQKALLSYSLEDLINGTDEGSDSLQKLYNDWAEAINNSNGDLDQEAVQALQERYDALVAEGLQRRDAWSQVTGYTGSGSQDASSGTWQSMGQDTADELNGRFTALQIAGESIANNMIATLAQITSIAQMGISTNGAVLEIRNMMIMTNSYLEDMVKYAKLTYTDFGTKMDNMYTRLKEI